MNSSKILIDLSYTQGYSARSGIFEYGKRVFYELYKKDSSVTILLLNNQPIDKWITDLKPNIIYLKSMRNSKAFYKEIYNISKDFDVVYFPYQLINHRIKLQNAKLVFTIHDLTELDMVRFSKLSAHEYKYITSFKKKIRYFLKLPLKLLNIYYLHLYRILKYNINHAYKVITISNSTKADIIKRFKVDNSKIEMISTSIRLSSEDISELNIKDFYLVVSANRYTKNSYRIIKSFDQLYSKSLCNKKVVVVGKLTDKIISRIKNKNMFVFLDYVSDEQFNYLMSEAYSLVFASLAEGFGIPPLEAMKYGTNVICSNIDSLKEIYKNVTFCNPYSVKDIKDTIINQKIFNKEILQEEYRKITSETEKDFNRLINFILKV